MIHKLEYRQYEIDGLTACLELRYNDRSGKFYIKYLDGSLPVRNGATVGRAHINSDQAWDAILEDFEKIGTVKRVDCST